MKMIQIRNVKIYVTYRDNENEEGLIKKLDQLLDTKLGSRLKRKK